MRNNVEVNFVALLQLCGLWAAANGGRNRLTAENVRGQRVCSTCHMGCPGGGVLWGLICSTGDTRSLLAGGDSDTERTGTAQPPVSETRESDHLHNRMPGNSRSTTGYLSLKEIQESIEIEADEAKLIIQPLLDTEKTFIKDLDDFLTHWEALELRRKELLHRRWMQNVWNPIQKRIEQHVLCRLSEGPHKMRVMLERYLKYCNVKGFVFLDNYDPVEYNPFEQHINRQCYSQVQDLFFKGSL
ncbi:hypothetical protein GN956_G16195 [Arapaima gigas]